MASSNYCNGCPWYKWDCIAAVKWSAYPDTPGYSKVIKWLTSPGSPPKTMFVTNIVKSFSKTFSLVVRLFDLLVFFILRVATVFHLRHCQDLRDVFLEW